MKVQGPGGAQGPSKSKDKSRVSGDGAGFGSMMVGGGQGAVASAPTQSIAYLDTLLAIQGAEDPAAKAAKKRMRSRADTLLKELDVLRMAMLNGTLTIGHMVDVADVVSSHREKIMDPALTALLDEIDLRAQVELAKLRVALGTAGAGERGLG